MTLNYKDRRLIANSLIGYGNPKTAKIAIFGIEEGGKQWGEYPEKDDNTLAKARRCVKDGFWPRELWLPEWSDMKIKTTERLQCYCCLKLQNKIEQYNAKIIQNFREDEFCKENEIVGNINPIGKPRLADDYGDKATAYFGVNSADNLHQYWDSVSTERLRLIKQAINNRNYSGSLPPREAA